MSNEVTLDFVKKASSILRADSEKRTPFEYGNDIPEQLKRKHLEKQKENAMKTAIILWTTDGAEYYLVEGDHSQFNGTFINSDMPLSEELFDFLFEKDIKGDHIHQLMKLDAIREALLGKSTILIECGYHF